MHTLLTNALFLALTTTASARCYDVSPAFPVPDWSRGRADLDPAFKKIHSKLNALMSDERHNTSSFSIELTSSTETLLGAYHTAKELNESRPGDTRVDGESLYRIASITKVFTTLGVLYQHEAGNLRLDDPISNYIPELAEDDSGAIPWRDISLRILASQLSGIPRDFAQQDLINYLPNPTDLGLPPASKEGLPTCDEYDGFDRPCNRSHLLQAVKGQRPLFAPNQRSTYSNLNFELLGLALENVTGVSYEQNMNEAIFKPLGMTSTALTKPDTDEHAVLPIGDNYWDVEEGVQSPTGGIYSSAGDMSKFVRYILTHYNALATGVNWFTPGSWATGTKNFYGMPFEIFRSDDVLLESRRPVTFTTKAGGLPGYFSRIIMLEEYGLGLTILVAGTKTGPELLTALQDIVAVEVVREAEAAVWRRIASTHAGTYTAARTQAGLNSSVSLTASASGGLVVAAFVSNGTDVLAGPLPSTVEPSIVNSTVPWRMQLTPTLLYRDEAQRRGEIWRMLVVLDRPAEREEEQEEESVFEEFCSTNVDYAAYAGQPINEVVFWREDGVVELPAWRVKLEKEGGKISGPGKEDQLKGEGTWKAEL